MVVFDLQHFKIQQIVKQEPLLLIDYLESVRTFSQDAS